MRPGFRAAAVAMLAAAATTAHGLTVLTVGKTAIFQTRGDRASAVVRFGRDPAFAAPRDVTCAGGVSMTLQVASYPQATVRVDAQDPVALPCAGWKRRGNVFRYKDATGAAGGVRKVVYGRTGFIARFDGPPFRAVAGPVGYAELWIDVGDARLVGRFHSFRKNASALIVTRKPSAAAAAGEADFWAVLDGSDHSAARQEHALTNLAKATKRDPKDGRPPFLAAMLHLYRFGQAITSYAQVSDPARADLVAANDRFAASLPLLWDGTRGDSRVPGFVAAAEFGLGVVQGDDALQAKALDDLKAAVAVNAFFNVFDLIPVIQALPPSDPRFAQIFALVKAYIDDPATLSCVNSQPEICADRGLAPRNVAGALTLFGDVYAKAGALDPANVTQAETWYTIASFGASQTPGYLFADAIAARLGHAAERAALYQDGDPSNDPPVIGAGPEACAVCHYR